MAALSKRRVRLSSEVELAYVQRHSEASATAPCLLMVPGFTFSSDVFCHQIEAFANDFQVIALDPRSHGDSSLTEVGNDYLTQAEDLRLFIDKLNLDQIILLGWSFGALATWACGTLIPERLKAHVCVDMPPVPLSADESRGVWVEGRIADMAGAYHALLSAEGQAAMMRDYAQHVMVERELNEDELDWIVNLSLRTPHTTAATLFAAGLFSNRLEQAQALEKQVPSRFYVASHWASVAREYLRKECSRSSVVAFGGHMMFWEYPEKFNDDLKAFIDSLE